MELSTFVRRASLFFFVLVCLLYLYGLGRVPFIGPDEPRYAEVAREMWLRGDVVSPTLGGHLWFEKPALLYWMMMACFEMFGVTEWAARLGPACAGLLTILCVFWVGSRVEDARDNREELTGLALCGSAALASSLGLIIFARGASFDVIVTMTTTLALACFFVAETEIDERKRRWLLAGFYAATGASLLAKGLIGIVLPYAIVFVYYLLRRAWPERQTRVSLVWGTLLAMLVSSVWYAPVLWQHGGYFVDQFFIQHHFARYLSDKYHHSQPFYFYIPVTLALCVPWSLFLVWALMPAPRSNHHAPTSASKLRVFALAWLIVPLLFFSFSSSKLPGYILPALPAAALLIGERLLSYLRGEATGIIIMRVTGALLFLLTISGVIFATRADYLSLARALALALPLIAASIVALVWTHKRELCAALLVCAAFTTTALTITYANNSIAQRESIRELLQQAAQQGYAATPVLQLHTVERSAEFYAAGRIDYNEDGSPLKLEGVAPLLEVARRKGGTALVIVPVEYVNQLTGYAPLETKIIGDNGGIALVAARAY